MYSLKILILALFIISLATASAFANRQNSMNASEVEDILSERLHRLGEAIGLTPQQQIQIQAIIAENQQEMRDLHKEIRANRAELRELLDNEDLDESRLRQLVGIQAELKIRKMMKRHGIRNRINSVLTDEQLQKRDALRQHRGGRREAFNRAEPLSLGSDRRPKTGGRGSVPNR